MIEAATYRARLTEASSTVCGHLMQPTLLRGLAPLVLQIIAIIVLGIIDIIIVAYAVKNIGYRVNDGVFKDQKHSCLNKKCDGKREQTLNNLSKSILSYFIMLLVIMNILDIFNVPIRTMLAGAG